MSTFVTIAARRTAEATHAKAEARTLAQLSGSVIGADDPLGVLMTRLRDAFGITAAAVLRREGDGWRVESSASAVKSCTRFSASSSMPGIASSARGRSSSGR